MKVKETIALTCEKLKMMNILPSAIATIGVTNQRETTLVWDKYTGKPLYNAISKYIFKVYKKFKFYLDNICIL